MQFKLGKSMNNSPNTVLINCSNLRTGGGVAVATSFINSIGLNKAIHSRVKISLLLSSVVRSNLDALNTNFENFHEVKVKNYYGISGLWQGLDREFRGFDLVFNVFGPIYSFRKRTVHITGFAQPIIIYPDNPITSKMTTVEKYKQKIKYFIQELFFSRSDALIVELDHVKNQLVKKKIFSQKTIHIVNSAVDSIFKTPEQWQELKFNNPRKKLKLGVISRNYPHKNLSILPFLKKQLMEKYILDVDFYVTFSDHEWNNCSVFFRKEIINVGSLTLAQCPTFYSYMDGVIFPSFLECFSAVPIESMIMKKPLFASDLPFIRDCCAEHANYFNPFDIDDIAKSIYSFYALSKQQNNIFINDAYSFVQKFSNSESRANAYLCIIEDFLERFQ